MTLANADLILRPGVLNSNTVAAQNGGRMAYSQIVSAVKNNLFPDVTAAERMNGITRWRKVFLHTNSDTVTALNAVRVYMDKLTPADDYLLIQAATATGTEASDKDETLLYGVGLLAANASVGAESITVNCEHADYEMLLPFRAGMLVRISNIPVGGGTGTEEFVPLSAVSITGASATLTFTGYPLANGYLAATPTIVSGVLEIVQVVGAFNAAVVTSAAGTLAHGTVGNLTVPSKGSINETWTLTFASATTFTVVGAVSGGLTGTGSIGADYAAVNPATSTPYFKISAAAWSGTFAAGDIVTFNTTQAALPFLVRNRVPAGSGSLAGNIGAVAIRGESA